MLKYPAMGHASRLSVDGRSRLYVCVNTCGACLLFPAESGPFAGHGKELQPCCHPSAGEVCVLPLSRAEFGDWR